MKTIKQQKILLYFLKAYKELLNNQKVDERNLLFNNFFSREELIEILEYLYLDKLEEFQIEKLNDKELLELIGNDASILEYYSYKLEESITATPTLSQNEVSEFFERTSNEVHYLYSKPTESWDDYDSNNYYSLLFKHGKTRRVFVIFTSDVNEEDKYAVTTKPSYFFDTEQQAKDELERILQQRKFKRDELKIMSLWKFE
ncbi:hypothetical protein SAMN05444411_102249 [Lutibacter oricola]|uniref:Uncharacterized protein n=1 Tax=Lutibacter oricola TaxID=762486 RepID=A0A1H2WP22_9FLAO|nr:hypothetical protein [Lutibacter oricola]SDW82341.1 hypothetical protein SAMN05444411_102249 [Lutibacter oricola]